MNTVALIAAVLQARALVGAQSPTRMPTTRPTKKPTPSPTRAPTRITAASYNKDDWKNLTVLFRNWQMANLAGYVGALFFVFSLAFLITVFDEFLARFEAQAVKSAPQHAIKSLRFTISQQMFRALVKTIKCLVIISLMLICTTGDVGFIVMTALGYGIGFGCLRCDYDSALSPAVAAKAAAEPKAKVYRTPFLLWISGICTCFLIVYAGVCHYSTMSSGFPTIYSSHIQWVDKQFYGFWLVPVALGMIATALLDAQLNFSQMEGSKAPGRSIMSCPPWISQPVFGRFGMSVGQCIVAFLMVVLNVLQFAGYLRNKKEAAKLKNIPITDAQWLEYVMHALGFAGSWTLASSLFFYARNQIFGRFFGVHISLSLPWHKWLGFVAFCEFTLHGALALIMYKKYFTVLPNVSPFLSNRGLTNFFGFLAYGCMLIMFIGALEIVRRRKYLVFMYSHQLWIPCLLFGAMHYRANAYIWVAPVVFVFYDKFAMKLLTISLKNQGTITKVSDKIVRIDITSRNSSEPLPAYVPGDNVYITVPAISRMHRHPFTITSYWPEDPSRIVLFAKVTGPWTSDLYSFASTNPKGQEVDITVDGYFGSKPAHYLHYAYVVYIAGGNGIAALIPVIKHYFAKREGVVGKLRLIWCINNKGDIDAFGWFLAELYENAEYSDIVLDIYISSGNVPRSSLVPVLNPIASAPEVQVRVKASPVSRSQVEMARVCDYGGSEGLGEEATSAVEWKAKEKKNLKSWFAQTATRQVFHISRFLLSVLIALSLILGFSTWRKTLPVKYINKTVCTSKDYLSPSKYVPCRLWFHSGALVVPVFFAAVTGSLFLFLVHLLKRAYGNKSGGIKASTVSVTSRSVPDLNVILSRRANFIEKRADVKSLMANIASIYDQDDKDLDGDSYSQIAVLAAGPDMLVNAIEKESAIYHTLHFYRESYQA